MKFTEFVCKFSDIPLAHGHVRCFGTSRTLLQVGEHLLRDFFLCYVEEIVEHNLGVTNVSPKSVAYGIASVITRFFSIRCPKSWYGSLHSKNLRVFLRRISEFRLGFPWFLLPRMRAEPKCKIASNQASLLLEGLILYFTVRRTRTFDVWSRSSTLSSSVLKRLKTLGIQYDERPSYLPCHKSRLAIGDSFIGFSSSCVSHDFLPGYFTQTVDVSKAFSTRIRGATYWSVEYSETSNVRCVRVEYKLQIIRIAWFLYWILCFWLCLETCCMTVFNVFNWGLQEINLILKFIMLSCPHGVQASPWRFLASSYCLPPCIQT